MVSAQQLCNGTLGENIFIGGDFGSGRENIIQIDPRIAPGYNYTTSTPPPDGSYTITNNMANWINNYGTWIAIPDNSADPYGYMMIVNASYTPGIFYEETIDGLCENTIYEFSADIINIVKRSATGHSLPELEFLINGELQYSTGPIAQDEKWKKYGFTFALKPGESSLKLTLVNKAPGGTGNDLALDNITFRPCGGSANISVDIPSPYITCENRTSPINLSTDIDDSDLVFQWQWTEDQGLNWKDIGSLNQKILNHQNNLPGKYKYRFITSGSEANLANEKCRTVSELLEISVHPVYYTQLDTFCEGSIYPFKDQLISQPGNYIDTFTSGAGCDSIVHLSLTQVPRRSISSQWNAIDPLCHDSSDGSIVIQSAMGGYPPYNYFLNQLEEDNNGRFEGLTSGSYTTEIIDRFGCSQQINHDLSQPLAMELYIPRDTTITLGQSLPIYLRSNYDLGETTWTPDISPICNLCIDDSIVPTASTTFTVTAANHNQCEVTKEFSVEIDKDHLPISIPNAFSPNRDGHNDIFHIISGHHLLQGQVGLSVYDRWGDQIFHSQVPVSNIDSGGWNGNIVDQPADSGVYIYKIELELIDGQDYIHTGTVQLIR
ncbi:hypothetical protein GCM10025777_54650 [Membranihabitans marinus]